MNPQEPTLEQAIAKRIVDYLDDCDLAKLAHHNGVHLAELISEGLAALRQRLDERDQEKAKLVQDVGTAYVEGIAQGKRESVFKHIVDPYADGHFEPQLQHDIPQDVQAELLRVSADKSISFYYLCAIYRQGQEESGETRRAFEALEQVEAELLMAKRFLNEAGTDPEAWLDGALLKLRAYLISRASEEKT